MSVERNHASQEPVDLDALTSMRSSMRMPESELEVLIRRGISFKYTAQSLGAVAFWAALALGFLWLALLSDKVKDPIPDYPIVSAVMALGAFAALGWLWMDRQCRNDRIVMNDEGLSLWRGQRRVRTVTWEALTRIRKVWPGRAMISARNETTIWLTSAVQQYDFLVAFAQWILPIDRSSRSLRAIVESAVGSGVRFRASTIAAPLSFVGGLLILALTLHSASEVFLRDDWNFDTLLSVAGATFFVALSSGCFWFAWIAFEGRKDEVVIRADGVEGRNRSGVTFVSWAEATHPDAMRAIEEEGNAAFVRDASGRKVIVAGVMRFAEISQLLLQYFWMRHVGERGWNALRTLDQLRL